VPGLLLVVGEVVKPPAGALNGLDDFGGSLDGPEEPTLNADTFCR
jgi:hypothetical protein